MGRHELAQRPLQQISRKISEDGLPRRVEKLQLAVEACEPEQNAVHR